MSGTTVSPGQRFYVRMSRISAPAHGLGCVPVDQRENIVLLGSRIMMYHGAPHA